MTTALRVVVLLAWVLAADRYHAGSVHGGAIVGQPAAQGGNLASQCSNGIDDDGDGKVDWFGNDGGGDGGCPTPDWPLGECTDPECAPASDAIGIGLASISPAVPAWPGNFKTPGTGGCPSDNVLAANTVYSYCALTGTVNVTGDNITCYGCQIRLTSVSGGAIDLNSHNNFRLVYSRIEPSTDQTTPIPFYDGFEYGFREESQAVTFERSHIHGYANGVVLANGGCNATHPCTFRGVFWDYPRNEGSKAAGTCPEDFTPGQDNCDHTDGPGCTANPTCRADYFTCNGCTLLGWQFEGGAGDVANTSAIAMQEGSNDTDGYDHLTVANSYITGWGYAIDFEEGSVQNTNGLFANNWYGSDYQPRFGYQRGWGSNGGSNKWICNRFNVASTSVATSGNGHQWTNFDSNDGRYVWSSDSDPANNASVQLHTADQNGITCPYTMPQCDDGLDNDGDGNIDYPWDSGCTSASDNAEADTASFPTTWDALVENHYYPGPSNTGVPAGTSLTNTSARSLNTAGMTINGENVTGTAGGQTGYGLLVNANNITIKNSKITTSFGTGTSVNASAGIKIAPGITGTRIENVEVDGSNATHACVWFEGAGPISVTALNCHNVCDGIFSWDGDNFSIIDSYIHDLSTAPSNGHTDGFQTEGAQHGTIRHNTIDIANGDTGTISIWNSRRNSTDITVDDNLLSGAGFIFYAEDYDPSEGSPVGGFTTTAIHHLNNKISTAKRWSSGGGNSPTACAGYWGVYFHTGNAYNGGPTDGWDRSGNIIIETGGSVNTEIPGCG